MYKSRLVLKIFTSPILSYTPPQRGEISNIRKKPNQTSIENLNNSLSIPESALYTPVTVSYEAKMLLYSR